MIIAHTEIERHNNKLTRENRFALYGEVEALVRTGQIKVSEAAKLEKLIGLTVDETEQLIL